jgi:hypothetical protein
MHKIRVSTNIRAPKETVWRVMLDDVTYQRWSSIFHEGSYAVTDWKEGSKALFLTPGRNGMLSKIVVNRPNEFLSIMHQGIVKNGEELRETDEAKQWAGALENYTLRDTGDDSILTIEIDVADEYKKYFEETWPKALQKLKEIVEAESSRNRTKLTA